MIAALVQKEMNLQMFSLVLWECLWAAFGITDAVSLLVSAREIRKGKIAMV
jgi:hypothetical protein